MSDAAQCLLKPPARQPPRKDQHCNAPKAAAKCETSMNGSGSMSDRRSRRSAAPGMELENNNIYPAQEGRAAAIGGTRGSRTRPP